VLIGQCSAVPKKKKKKKMLMMRLFLSWAVLVRLAALPFSQCCFAGRLVEWRPAAASRRPGRRRGGSVIVCREEKKRKEDVVNNEGNGYCFNR